ncbi:MAG: bifunctional hydroxymethylpyrimidine kinase/phosphomethylpyrimidine kinase [Nitrospinota bacterium]|nr:bifunctional hydroxymethylpyrimidine kinase/phosphomethylpyrimidine kinase [Nitrospinota bacterium]
MTIAGSDSSGGAGIQADLKTFAAYGIFGKTVITSITAQNTSRVVETHHQSAEVVMQQLRAVLEEGRPLAAKTGMLGDDDLVIVIARLLKRHKIRNLVVDPVFRSTSGKALLTWRGVQALRKWLLPLAVLVTPNIAEAKVLADRDIKSSGDRLKAAKAILKTGVKNVLITGGHLKGKPEDFFYDGKKVLLFESKRILKKNVHGTGCVFSAAVASGLALGKDLVSSIETAKGFINASIAGALSTGEGTLCADPLAQFYKDRDRYPLLQRTLNAAETLRKERIGFLVPEVQSNIGFALKGAQDRGDVVGFPGRIMKMEQDILIPVHPRFGGSRHVADIVLTVMRFDPDKRAVMNIKYSKTLVKVCRKLKFKIASFDRAGEPKGVRKVEGSSLEWGTEKAILEYGSVPDIIFDRGGMGKEEMIRVIASDVEDLVQRILKIQRLFKKMDGKRG